MKVKVEYIASDCTTADDAQEVDSNGPIDEQTSSGEDAFEEQNPIKR